MEETNWNCLSSIPPEFKLVHYETFKLPPSLSSSLTRCMTKGSSMQNPLLDRFKVETSVLIRLSYKLKGSYRNHVLLRITKKMCKLLTKFHSLNLTELFNELLGLKWIDKPTEYEWLLPSTESLCFIMVRMISAATLLSHVIINCEELTKQIMQLLHLGHRVTTFTFMSANISSIWAMSAEISTYYIEICESVRNITRKMKPVLVRGSNSVIPETPKALVKMLQLRRKCSLGSKGSEVKIEERSKRAEEEETVSAGTKDSPLDELREQLNRLDSREKFSQFLETEKRKRVNSEESATSGLSSEEFSGMEKLIRKKLSTKLAARWRESLRRDVLNYLENLRRNKGSSSVEEKLQSNEDAETSSDETDSDSCQDVKLKEVRSVLNLLETRKEFLEFLMRERKRKEGEQSVTSHLNAKDVNGLVKLVVERLATKPIGNWQRALREDILRYLKSLSNKSSKIVGRNVNQKSSVSVKDQRKDQNIIPKAAVSKTQTREESEPVAKPVDATEKEKVSFGGQDAKLRRVSDVLNLLETRKEFLKFLMSEKKKRQDGEQCVTSHLNSKEMNGLVKLILNRLSNKPEGKWQQSLREDILRYMRNCPGHNGGQSLSCVKEDKNNQTSARPR